MCRSINHLDHRPAARSLKVSLSLSLSFSLSLSLSLSQIILFLALDHLSSAIRWPETSQERLKVAWDRSIRKTPKSLLYRSLWIKKAYDFLDAYYYTRHLPLLLLTNSIVCHPYSHNGLSSKIEATPSVYSYLISQVWFGSSRGVRWGTRPTQHSPASKQLESGRSSYHHNIHLLHLTLIYCGKKLFPQYGRLSEQSWSIR